MFTRILICVGLLFNINHHVNLSEDQQMISIALIATATVFDLLKGD